MSGTSWPLWLALVLVGVVLLALLAVAVAGRFTLGPDRGARSRTDPQPVPLPPHPDADDVAAVRFSYDVPGYAPAQVDAALDVLAERLRGQQERIDRLEREAHGASSPVEATGADGAGARNPE